MGLKRIYFLILLMTVGMHYGCGMRFMSDDEIASLVESAPGTKSPVYSSPSGLRLAGISGMAVLSLSAVQPEANAETEDFAFSPDGLKIAFSSISSNLVAGDTNGMSDIFIKTLSTGAIERVSTTSTGLEANDYSFASAFSSDGLKIAFLSGASNLVAGDTNGTNDIFVKTLSTGAVERISTSSAGVEANNHSFTPFFSPDGLKIVFVSRASNLVAGDTNGVDDIFVKTLSTGAIERVSMSAAGVQANSSSSSPLFSPDGFKVVFLSAASNLVAGDTNGANDIFVKTLSTGAIERVSTTSAGVQGNAHSEWPSFSPDGLKVIFNSEASNLVAGDTNGTYDVFIKTLATGAIERVSTTSGGGGG